VFTAIPDGQRKLVTISDKQVGFDTKQDKKALTEPGKKPLD
jgi:hypothetical protein